MMKLKADILSRLLEKGAVHMNEPAAAPAPAESGGGDAPVEAGGGADAAPSSEPESDSGDDSGIDWGNLFSEDDDSEPAAQDQEPTEPAAEQQVPQAETSASDATAEAPSQEPATPETVTTEAAKETQEPSAPEAPTEPAQPQPTQEELAAAKQQARQTWVDELAQNYALTEDEAAGMLTNPGETLPKIVANMHAQVFDNTMQFLRNNLGSFITQQLQQNEARSEAANAFFSEWPELKEHEALVMELGADWRRRNPTASRQEFLQKVGPMVWVAAGLDPGALVSRGAKAPAPNGAPAPAPAQQGGYSPAPQQAAAAGQPPSHGNENPFAALAEEWQND